MKTTSEMIQNVFSRKEAYEIKQKARRTALRKTLTAVCCFCLVLGLAAFGMWHLGGEREEWAYRILLDVNPSIEICANWEDVVVEANALNRDGEQILRDSDVEGKPVGEAVKELTDALVENGYISAEANSILVSVEETTDEKTEAVKESISEGISESLANREVEGAVILQTLPEDSELNRVAEEYSISVGKAQLINQILEQNKLRTFAELSSMSIHELNVLKVSYYVQLEQTSEVGEPGYMAYIGQENANAIAVGDAAAVADEVEINLDCANGMMIYRVEFEDGTHDYRYDINAVTGEIISAQKQEVGKNTFVEKEKDSSFVGENAALYAALDHAGMTDSILTWCKQEKDWENGMAVYKLFFTDGKYSGRYVVDARTGEILQHSLTQEYHDRSVNAQVIGEAAAKRIALAKDGLVDGNVSKYECKLQAENSAYTYVMNFICNGVKYRVQVDAVSGAVLVFEKNGLQETGAPSVEDGSHTSAETGERAPAENTEAAPAEGTAQTPTEDGRYVSPENGVSAEG